MQHYSMKQLNSIESHDCLKVNIYKSLGGGVIVLGADNKILYALVIILGRYSILFNQLHTSLGAGVIIVDASDKYCV